MSHLKSLTNLGVELNPCHLGEWPLKIGSYMLNFGGIELISFQYLDALEVTRQDFHKNLDRRLSARIGRILQLVDASKISDADKAEVKSLWLEAKKLSHWRNRIAHNPVLPTWKPGSDSDRDPPDLIGVPEMKQLKRSNVTDSISIEGMAKLIDASADLAQRLHAAIKRLQVVA